MFRAPFVALLALVSVACANQIDPASGVEAERATEGAALQVSDGVFNVWLTDRPTVEQRAGRSVVVVRGSSNRELQDVFSFVPDDVFGQAQVTGRRSFEVVLEVGHELSSITSGLPLFVRLDPRRAELGTRTMRFDLVFAPTSFTGAASLFIDSVARPVFVGGENPVRYRGQIAHAGAALAGVQLAGRAAEVIAVDAATSLWQISFDDIAAALVANGRPFLASGVTTTGSAVSKRAAVRLVVANIALTAGDAYDVWPSPSCTPGVLACMDNGGDLGACGSYREVQACTYADRCEVLGASPFALTAFDASDELAGPTAAFNAGCSSGGTWCGVAEVQAFQVQECLAAPATLTQVNDALASLDQAFVRSDEVLDRSSISQVQLLSTSYSAAGPSLLLALDVVGGGGEIQVAPGIAEVPCHNCTDFADDILVFYPNTGVVLRVIGRHGYDS